MYLLTKDMLEILPIIALEKAVILISELLLHAKRISLLLYSYNKLLLSNIWLHTILTFNI